MYNKVETGILLLFSLVLFDFVSGLPLDGDKRIDDHGNGELQEMDKVLPQSLNEKTSKVPTAVDLSQEQNNEDLIPMETQFAYGYIPSEQPPYGGFVNEDPRNENSRQYKNTKHNGKVGKVHWSFEQDYFRDKISNFQRSEDQGSYPYHPHFEDNINKYHHFHHPNHPHYHSHRPQHHWKGIYRSEITQSPSTTQSASVANTTPTISPSLIDVRIGE